METAPYKPTFSDRVGIPSPTGKLNRNEKIIQAIYSYDSDRKYILHFFAKLRVRKHYERMVRTTTYTKNKTLIL